MKPATLAPATVLILKMENDMSGSFARVSARTKAPRRAMAAAKRPIVFPDVQP